MASINTVIVVHSFASAGLTGQLSTAFAFVVLVFTSYELCPGISMDTGGVLPTLTKKLGCMLPCLDDQSSHGS